ncbi:MULTISPECIES: thioredoxin domain-containing protein [Pseudomonas]|uniref:Disulfide bond formation protein DsbA n=1 Tax=Pseudomonas neustonica TaxID=2487346 RepID=A0ABX9XEP3_9PSED|nr:MULTISPECIES: thioredoxin domain-containing protein [Pseudomonas]MAB17739.1 disulfide bond formation protein DsbA [Roseobacter sp.]MBA6418502.1 thioredoxin domain-containing protein [Pseudomonas sp. 5Ae-yellow]ROZ79934.1 disulfide bond formation protein DsbA [Pseudomonas sp. SSM44]ROZ80520.1 disulfide bond formation protein DsbA [Pseudomonas neustonica]|tara:strand:- start:6814 stop:7491 length:678 start_codon:yes stop_codon:yes gene_type:complete
MNRRAIFVVVCLVLIAAFSAAVLFKPQPQQPQKTATTGEKSVAAGEPIANQQALVRFHSPTFGPADAPVIIVEFFDPSCEACRAFYPIVKQILAEYPGQVRLVLRYTMFHQGSEEVSRILEAARLQDVYEPVLEAVLEVQPAWHDDPKVAKAWGAAEAAGLDLSQAREDMQSERISAILDQDMQDVKTIGVRGTPTFFVNGRQLTEFGPKPLLRLVQESLPDAQK